MALKHPCEGIIIFPNINLKKLGLHYKAHLVSLIERLRDLHLFNIMLITKEKKKQLSQKTYFFQLFELLSSPITRREGGRDRGRKEETDSGHGHRWSNTWQWICWTLATGQEGRQRHWRQHWSPSFHAWRPDTQPGHTRASGRTQTKPHI